MYGVLTTEGGVGEGACKWLKEGTRCRWCTYRGPFTSDPALALCLATSGSHISIFLRPLGSDLVQVAHMHIIVCVEVNGNHLTYITSI